MKITGLVIGLIGAAVSIGALFYPTSVDVTTLRPALDPLSNLSSYTPQIPGAVYNLGRLQEQMMLYVCGIGLCVAGIIVFALGSALEQSIRRDRLPFAAASAEPATISEKVEPVVQREMTPDEIFEMNKAGNLVVVGVAVVVGVMFLVAMLAIFMTR